MALTPATVDARGHRGTEPFHRATPRPEVLRLEGASFDRVARELGDPHPFQSAAWARVREVAGWQPHFLAVRLGERIEAAVLCLERRKLGFSVVQIARGPVLRAGPDRAGALASALQAVRSLARGRVATHVRIAPDLVAADEWAERVLLAAGARRAVHGLGHRATLRLDLAPEDGQLLARMESRTRYAIRKAEQAGVEVRSGRDSALLADFHSLYRETCERAGIHGVPQGHATAMVDAGVGVAYVAYDHGAPVSAALVLRHGTRAAYLLGGSRRGVKHTGAELVQWTAIRDAKAAGIREYDLQGIPESPAQGDPLYGVYLFKRGFGGERVDVLGDFDLGSPRLIAGLGARVLYGGSRARALARLLGRRA